MGTQSAAIHTNPNLKHQVEFAEYLSNGLKRHGVNPTITSDRKAQGDIHVVLGPHYAKSDCLNHRTILLDRGFWGDPAVDVSLAWMTNDGGREMAEGMGDGRPKPELKPWKTSDMIIELLDYGATPNSTYPVRHHPTNKRPTESLQAELDNYGIAMGGVGTALVSAAIQGLAVICLDMRSVCRPISSQNIYKIVRPCRKQWLNNLSYMNWAGSEIESGEAFEHLL